MRMKMRERAHLFATMLAPITVAIVPLRRCVALTAEEDMTSLLIHIFALPSRKGARVLAVPVGPLDQLEHVLADLAPDAGINLGLALLISGGGLLGTLSLNTTQHS
jgi:hypothetical protein